MELRAVSCPSYGNIINLKKKFKALLVLSISNKTHSTITCSFLFKPCHIATASRPLVVILLGMHILRPAPSEALGLASSLGDSHSHSSWKATWTTVVGQHIQALLSNRFTCAVVSNPQTWNSTANSNMYLMWRSQNWLFGVIFTCMSSELRKASTTFSRPFCQGAGWPQGVGGTGIDLSSVQLFHYSNGFQN
jgi:hypothetical protein